MADDLFPGPTLPKNEHGQLRGGQSLDRIFEHSDCRTFADNPHSLGHLLSELFLRSHQLFAVLRGLQSRCCLNAKLRQAFFVFCGERPGELIDHLKSADPLAIAVEQRHAEKVFRFVSAFDIDLFVKPRIAIRIVDLYGRAGLNDFADDSRTVGKPQRAPFDSQCRACNDLPVILVPDEDAGAISFQQPCRLIGDQFQQGNGFSFVAELRGDFQDRFQTFAPPLAGLKTANSSNGRTKPPTKHQCRADLFRPEIAAGKEQ